MSDEPTKKKAKAKRPTQRTLEVARKNGHTAQVVERWQMIPGHPGGGVRQDLFGCIDVIILTVPNSIRVLPQIVGIQCGADSGHSGHKKKCLAEPRLKLWLEAGGLFFIHSWAKKGERGKVKHWQCRIEELTLADFEKEPDLFK